MDSIKGLLNAYSYERDNDFLSTTDFGYFESNSIIEIIFYLISQRNDLCQ